MLCATVTVAIVAATPSRVATAITSTVIDSA